METTDFNNALKVMERNPSKSVSRFRNFIKKHGENKEVWLNLSVAYKKLGDYKNTTAALMKAADKNMPFSDGTFTDTYGTALNNLGLLAHSFEKEDEAEKFFHLALRDPTHDVNNTLWNLSVSRLRRYCSDDKSIDVDLAWRLYEFRFKRTGADPLKNAKEGMRFWDALTRVDSLCILAEQGFGDMLMYGRYLKYVDAGKVWVQCDKQLSGVFEKAGYKTCYSTAETDSMLGYPIGALPRMLGYIPDGQWLRDRYVPRKPSGELRIACVWQGNKGHANDANRSCDKHHFKKLAKYGRLYNFNSKKTEGFELLEVTTWDDTIKALEEVDLVISVDTSIVHMCGSLGKPCWVLMPKVDCDFRWGLSSMGYKNVWYPSVTVIRNPNDWYKTFEQVHMLLEDVCVNN